MFGPHAHPYGQSYGEWAADWYDPESDEQNVVARTCTVPNGKALLFPVLNTFSGATEGDPPEQKTEAYQRKNATPPMRAATGLHAGERRGRLRGLPHRRRGLLPDGHAPPEGTHTINFGGSGTDPAFTIDVTYTITVAGHHKRR